jgi:ESS family glutamate:Na+ symporter
MGFGQGSGQALSFGRIFENTYGFAGGANFGLMIAAVGFMVACIGGAIHILVRRRNGSLIAKNLTEYEGTEKISSPNEVPATESVDRLSIQVALITAVYFVVFLIMYGVEQLEGGNFLNNTIKPLFWGFNFLFGSVVALLVKVMFDFFKKKKVMERDYTNDYLLNRISGFSFDLMIIAGIAAIKIEVLIPLIIPLVILAVVGTFITYFYVRKVSYYLYPTYKDEGFLVMFGMLTGTASTGMILLREVDPHYETPAANNLVYQQIYAIMFGFPIYVFIAYAPLGLNETWITVAVLTLLFIIYNIIIFRKKIFKKKAKI